MTAVTDFIADLNACRGWEKAAPILGTVDKFIAALQQIEGGNAMSDVDTFIADLRANRDCAGPAPIIGTVDKFVAALTQLQGGATPALAIVQHGIADIGSAVVFAQAPAQGNWLVAVGTHNVNTLVINTGWAEAVHINGTVNDGVTICQKIALAGESTSQNPIGTAATGVLAIFEISGGQKIIDVTDNKHDVNANPNIAFSLTTTVGAELILGVIATATANVNLPTAINNATQDDTKVTATRAGASFHVAAPAAGVFTPGATWAANPTAIAGVAVAIR